MSILINLIISGLSIFIAAQFLTGVHVTSFVTALIVAAVLTVVNVFIKPIVLILTLPINIMTLGLFTLVINGLMVLLASRLVSGFTVDNVWWAILFGLVVSVISSILHGLTK
jgi:putative membrane protein